MTRDTSRANGLASCAPVPPCPRRVLSVTFGYTVFRPCFHMAQVQVRIGFSF